MNTTRSFNLNRDIAMDEEIHRFRDNLASNQEVILRGVINRILGVQLEGDLVEALQDGIVLCELFRKLVPDRNIPKPHTSKNLSFLQKRDNISLFTNACRSISIPDVLLITNSYFDNHNNDLLVSGLFTFFIWVLNLGIPESSSRVTMRSLLEEGSSDVSDRIANLSDRLCSVIPSSPDKKLESMEVPQPKKVVNDKKEEFGEASVPENEVSDKKESVEIPQPEEDVSDKKEEFGEASVPENEESMELTQPENGVSDMKEESGEASVPVNEESMEVIPPENEVSDEDEESMELTQPENGVSDMKEEFGEAYLPENEESIEVLPPENEVNALMEELGAVEPPSTSDPFIEQSPQHQTAISSPSSSSSLLIKEEWMKQHGVEPICPIVDNQAHSDCIDHRVNKFINELTNTVDSRKPVFITERNTIQAEFAEEQEASFFSDDRAIVQEPQPWQQPSITQARSQDYHASGRKRRNIDWGNINVRNVKSRVYDDVTVSQPSLQYVERIGKPRLVAGAVMQPRYIEGIDEEGRVHSRIQVRSVVSHPFPRLSRSRPIAEMAMEPPRPRGGLFEEEGNEVIDISDEQIVQRALYDENGEISQEVLEDRLDKDIRESFHQY